MTTIQAHRKSNKSNTLTDEVLAKSNGVSRKKIQVMTRMRSILFNQSLGGACLAFRCQFSAPLGTPLASRAVLDAFANSVAVGRSNDQMIQLRRRQRDDSTHQMGHYFG